VSPSARGATSTATASATTCDNDGVPDIAIGSWRGGYGRVFSGASGALLFEWREPPGDQTTGLQIGGAGDLDGDAGADVLTGFAASRAAGLHALSAANRGPRRSERVGLLARRELRVA
jgi:hypothetical protein